MDVVRRCRSDENSNDEGIFVNQRGAELRRNDGNTVAATADRWPKICHVVNGLHED